MAILSFRFLLFAVCNIHVCASQLSYFCLPLFSPNKEVYLLLLISIIYGMNLSPLNIFVHALCSVIW